MKLQVTKVKTFNSEAKRSHELNASSSDACNLRIQSYIHGMSKKEKKVTQMSNNTNNTINMMNVSFKPEGQLKTMNVQYSVKAQLGRPVDPNSARQKRLATAPGKKTGRPINPFSARQQRLAELDAKRANGTLKRGRPVNPNSARQVALREAIAKAIADNGGNPITNVMIMEDDISPAL